MDFLDRYFQYPDLLWLMLAVPALLFLCLLHARRKRRRLAEFASINYSRIIMAPGRTFSALRRISLLLAVLFIIISAAGPRYGIKERKHQLKGLDIVMAVDVSKSMNAIDIKPSRLKKTRMLVDDLLKRLSGNRTGLVAFSGTAYVQSPLTADYSAVTMFLDVLGTDLIPLGGTDIEQALDKALSLFIIDETKYKVIVLFTDGQETAGNSGNVIKKMKEQGIRLFIIGMAGSDPVPVPIFEDGHIKDYQRDEKGDIVQTFLVDEPLRKLAGETGGSFYRVADYGRIDEKIAGEIKDMEKKDFEQIVTSDLIDQSPVFTAIAFIFLLAFIILSYRTLRRQSFDYR